MYTIFFIVFVKEALSLKKLQEASKNIYGIFDICCADECTLWGADISKFSDHFVHVDWLGIDLQS